MTTPIEIAQSTPTARAIGNLVEQHYSIGKIVDSELLGRSFNQVYRLQCESGQKVVVRLCTFRPRGEPNVEFEAAVLDHLAKLGCAVAKVIDTSSGRASFSVDLPEGNRPIIVFEHLDGEATGEASENIEAFARGMAQLHEASLSYKGPKSLYTWDLTYLLHEPFERLVKTPNVSAGMWVQFEKLLFGVQKRIEALGPLQQVICHGDAHSENNFVATLPNGNRQARFFDFDDAAPGFLAYDLAIYPWYLIPHVTDREPTDAKLNQWRRYIDTYRSVRHVPDADLAAVPAFIAARKFWNMGESAGRVATWGTQSLSVDWLTRQIALLTKWENLTLPY